MNKIKAFTLIELLVVIVVIGILATLATATYRGAIEDAENGKITAEIKQKATEALSLRVLLEAGSGSQEQLMIAEFDLIDAVITLARKKEKKTLLQIIDDGGCADCVCRNYSFNSPSIQTQSCIDTWNDLVILFNSVTDINISFLQTDPWGSPYLIDQNEGESGHPYCRQDNIFSAGPDKYHEVQSGTEMVLGDGFQQRVSFYDTAQCGS